MARIRIVFLLLAVALLVPTALLAGRALDGVAVACINSPTKACAMWLNSRHCRVKKPTTSARVADMGDCPEVEPVETSAKPLPATHGEP